MENIRRFVPFRIAGATLPGLWYAYLWMMFGSLILSLLLKWSQLGEGNLGGWTYVVHALSVILGSFVSGKRSNRKGWHQGALTGLMYSIVLFIVSFLALDSTIEIKDFLLFIPALLLGTLGGIAGKNAQTH